MKNFLVILTFLAITKALIAMDAEPQAAGTEPGIIRITLKLRTSSPDGKDSSSTHDLLAFSAPETTTTSMAKAKSAPIHWSALNYDTIHEIYCRTAEESGNPLSGLHATKELITNYDTFPAAVDFTDFNPYVLAANVAKKRGSEPNLKNFRHHVAVIITKTYLQTLGIELESDRKTRADIALRDFYFKLFKAQGINLDETSLKDQEKHLSAFLHGFCKPLGFKPTLALSRPNRYILDFPGLDGTSAAESKAKEVTAKVVKETDRVVEQAKEVGERVGKELGRFLKRL